MSAEWTPGTLSAVRAFFVEHGLASHWAEPVRIGDGHSNLTYRIGGVVLRRPPPPPVPPGAHDVLREARIVAALGGTGVPVARILATAAAGEVLDVPFYVMEHITGHVVTDRLPPRFAGEPVRRAIGFELADRLADLHAVDWRAAGLEGFGRPEGFNQRHVRRIETLMRSGGAVPPAEFEDLLAWILARVPPESGSSIVHGDYRLGNVIWADAAPTRLLAILDWELATIGDPMLDVGYLMICYPEPGRPTTPTQDLGAALLEPGFPSLDDMLSRYADRSGRSLEKLDWYAATSAWKTGVLYDYSRRQGRDSYYADPQLAHRFMAAGRRFAGLS
jgi:aminoglycoside phosphotransferase (APT) family kinase protein